MSPLVTHASTLLHIVMHEPEIPNNTGNIGRTCIATGCALHLVHPLGFEVSEKALRRAGLDYWPRLNVRQHADWSAYQRDAEPGGVPGSRLWLTSGKGGVAPWNVPIRRGDHIVFGRETRGLPDELLEQHTGRVLQLPLLPGERGLNVATAVCALVYEGVRQMLQRGEVQVDSAGRLNPAPGREPV